MLTKLPITDLRAIHAFLAKHTIHSSAEISPAHMQVSEDMGHAVLVLVYEPEMGGLTGQACIGMTLTLYHMPFVRDWVSYQRNHSPEFYLFFAVKGDVISTYLPQANEMEA